MVTKEWRTVNQEAKWSAELVKSFITEMLEKAQKNEQYNNLLSLLFSTDIVDLYELISNVESPMEAMFVLTWGKYGDRKNFGIFSQIEIPNTDYRVDFLIEDHRENSRNDIYVEIDGYEYHSSKEQKAHDTKRDRKLTELGYRVVRFTGSEIYNDGKACIDQLMKIAVGGNK